MTFETIEDYVAYWNAQSLETLRAIATEYMGGYDECHSKEELVEYLKKGMEDYCAEHTGDAR